MKLKSTDQAAELNELGVRMCSIARLSEDLKHVHVNGKDKLQNYENINVVQVDYFVDKKLNMILSHLLFVSVSTGSAKR